GLSTGENSQGGEEGRRSERSREMGGGLMDRPKSLCSFLISFPPPLLFLSYQPVARFFLPPLRSALCSAAASSSGIALAGPGLAAPLIDRERRSARSMTCAPLAAPAAGASPSSVVSRATWPASTFSST